MGGEVSRELFVLGVEKPLFPYLLFMFLRGSLYFLGKSRYFLYSLRGKPLLSLVSLGKTLWLQEHSMASAL